MSPLFFILVTNLVTFVPAALLALGLVFTPWVRSQVHVPETPSDVTRARPDSAVSLTLSVAAFLAVLLAFAPLVEGMLPSWLTLTSDPFEFQWHDFSRELIFGSLALILITLCSPSTGAPRARPCHLRAHGAGARTRRAAGSRPSPSSSRRLSS